MSILISSLYQFGDFSLDPQGRVLKKGREAVPLTPKAFDVLLLLVQNAGRIVTKDELMKAVWTDSFVEDSNLTQTIFMVRKALDETTDRRYILTVQGQGYRFLVPVTEANNEPETETLAAAPTTEKVREMPLPSPPAQARNWRSAVAVFALVVIALLSLGLLRLHRSPAEQPAKIMLAVLPFDNFTGDPGAGLFQRWADGRDDQPAREPRSCSSRGDCQNIGHALQALAGVHSSDRK